MKRRKAASPRSPLIRLVGLEAAVAATGIAGCLAAVAAPGDLDPAFGDVGRQSNIELPSYDSSLWSVDVQADDSVLFGGGGEYEYYTTYQDDFFGRLLPNGTLDAGFAAAALTGTAVYDTALQSDGKVIGVGVARQPDGRMKLVVLRLQADGSLDPGFGLGGQVIISDGSSSREAGYSVVVDPDGRIVVAGQRGNELLVARLLPNGTLDAGFGAAGVFVGRELVSNLIRIAGVPGGAYRVALNYRVGNYNGCGVAGLTSAGALDAAFGSGGYATQQSPGYSDVWCRSLAVQPDGRLLLGGIDGGVDGYIVRLLANGAPDPSFSAGEVDSRFRSVSALAVSPGGTKIFVAGEDRNGYSGALIVRLLADGTRDTAFGRDGATTVDLSSNTRRYYSPPTVNDMKVTTGGGLVVGGTDFAQGTAFVARLLGDTAGGSPGVLGLKQSRMLATEQAGQIVLAVQRTGGSSGPIAVTYSTRDFPLPPAPGSELSPGAQAVTGVDYTSTTGRLTWADGDVGEREIVVPIANDANAEPPEFFEVVLESPEGGA
ncbi:MAG: Calx-beta domain-containing protein, partial [Steroidobacteraceae bacterium]